jgi:hypothetical protein
MLYLKKNMRGGKRKSNREEDRNKERSNVDQSKYANNE